MSSLICDPKWSISLTQHYRQRFWRNVVRQVQRGTDWKACARCPFQSKLISIVSKLGPTRDRTISGQRRFGGDLLERRQMSAAIACLLPWGKCREAQMLFHEEETRVRLKEKDSDGVRPSAQAHTRSVTQPMSLEIVGLSPSFKHLKRRRHKTMMGEGKKCYIDYRTTSVKENISQHCADIYFVRLKMNESKTSYHKCGTTRQ